MTTMNSEIISFFNGKNIFLTGATGFVGKLLIDQLLRKCDPNKLYLLIRSKKGIEPTQRLQQLFQDVVYERLTKERRDFVKKVQLVNGDLSEANLGLNEDDHTKLIENVDVVIHGGATVRFDECIKKATSINVKGTISIIKLSHQIKKLQSFVYISTAFANCPQKEIKEEFYDPPINCDDLVKISDNLQNEELEIMTQRILGNWPNTYSFTKAVAENAIKTYATGLPICVFRPAIIISSSNDPVPGWIDNVYGPTGLLAGAAAGVIRVIKADPKAEAATVPADMVAFAIVAATYKTSLMGPTNEIPIYNYVTSNENPFTWADYLEICLKYGKDIPIEKGVWKHSCKLEPNPFLFAIYSFFLHLCPAALIDLVLFFLMKTPIALKIIKKVNKFMNAISYFATQTWNFKSSNLEALWTGLNKTDQQLFNFNMKELNWDNYFKDAIPGIRLYIFKESMETVPAALKKRKRQEIIQSVITTCLYGLVAWVSWNYIARLAALWTSQ